MIKEEKRRQRQLKKIREQKELNELMEKMGISFEVRESKTQIIGGTL
ncbi:hypothetical protein STFE110948_02910 [Streptobacillus felis]|nr:hypothetical protein [Streptobacillus felis]